MLSWFGNSRAKDKRQSRGMLLLSSDCHHKRPNCDEIIHKYDSQHTQSCEGNKDLRNEEQEAKHKDVIGEVRQEEVSKGQRDMSDLCSQPPGEPVPVTSQSELDDSFSDLRALLDSDSD